MRAGWWYDIAIMPLLSHRDHSERPGGSFDRFTLNELSTVKIINIRPHQELSLQIHKQRAEFWHILSGGGEVIINDVAHPARMGDEFESQAGEDHRATAGLEGLSFLEIALGDFIESDETRLPGHHKQTPPTATNISSLSI